MAEGRSTSRCRTPENSGQHPLGDEDRRDRPDVRGCRRVSDGVWAMTKPLPVRPWNSSSAISPQATCLTGSTSSTSPPPTTEPSNRFASCADDHIPPRRARTSLVKKKMIHMSDTQRLNILAVDKKAYDPLYALEKYIHRGSLGEALLSLIKLRASQINEPRLLPERCMPARRARPRSTRSAGRVLAGWKEAKSVYSDREQAALLMTEEVTLIADDGVSKRPGKLLQRSTPSRRWSSC